MSAMRMRRSEYFVVSSATSNGACMRDEKAAVRSALENPTKRLSRRFFTPYQITPHSK